MWPFLALLALPILEIALFIQVGEAIGVLPTLGLVVLSALAGVALIRGQGLQTVRNVRASLSAGKDPAGPLADGALLFVAGALLLLPGFFTDAAALVLLVPAARLAIIRSVTRRLRARGAAAAEATYQHPRRNRPDTLDAEYEVLDDVPPNQRGASGWTRPQS